MYCHGNRAATIIAATRKIAAKEFAMTILPRHPPATDESVEKIQSIVVYIYTLY
jgi:hypothetical protein